MTTISAGVTSSGTTPLTSGDDLAVYGTAVSFTLEDNASEEVYSGGSSISTTVSGQ
jgi:hypothetical protein